MKKSFSIIGIDSFGIAVAKELKSLGQTVIAVDRTEEKLNELIDIVDHSAYGDITSEPILRELGLSHVDHTIISLDNFEDAILITLILHQLGVPQITVRINSEYQEKIAYKVGASLCIFPDRSIGKKIARKLISNDILEYYDLDKDYGVYEMKVRTDKFRDTYLNNLDLRTKFGVNIILIKRNDQTIFPTANDTFLPGDIIIVVSNHLKFNKFQEYINE